MAWWQHIRQTTPNFTVIRHVPTWKKQSINLPNLLHFKIFNELDRFGIKGIDITFIIIVEETPNETPNFFYYEYFYELYHELCITYEVSLLMSLSIKLPSHL